MIGVLDGFGIETAQFCGISIGRLTGLWLAIHRAERFSRLAVSNPPPESAMPPLGKCARKVAAKAWAALPIPPPRVGLPPPFASADPNAVARLTDTLRHSHAEGYAKCCDVLATADVRALVHQADVDVQVIGARTRYRHHRGRCAMAGAKPAPRLAGRVARRAHRQYRSDRRIQPPAAPGLSRKSRFHTLPDAGRADLN